MAGAFENSGHKYAAVMQSRFFTGLYTNRNPLSDPGTPYLYRNYSPRYEGLIDGSNVEITNRLTLARRPGLSTYNSGTLPAINSFYSFRQFTPTSETISVIADGSSDVYDATDPSTYFSIFTKTVQSPSSFQSVGNTLYFGNGTDQEKYYLNGPGSGLFYGVAQAWGISSGGSGGVIVNTAGNGVNSGPTGTVFVNPNNVTSAVAFATCALVTSGGAVVSSDNLLATQFGFGIGSQGTIVGIKVTVETNIDSAAAYGVCGLQVGLMKNNALVTTMKTKYVTGVGTLTYTYGSSSDLWGTTWSTSDVNSTTFGALLQATASITHTTSVRNVKITIYLTAAPLIAVSGAAGTMAATTGYKYVYAYGNSVTKHVSSSTPSSASTGVFAAKLNVGINLVASTDSQVDQIRLFRTTDGGSLFFEVPGSPFPNTTATVTDNATDAVLNIFSVAPTIFSNNPPPIGLMALTYHQGRIWGAVNNTVFYSGGPDTLVGNGNEAFPPQNFFMFPSSVIRMVPTANGIFVFTISDVYFIGGTTNTPANGTLFFSVPFIQGLGLLSYFALDVQGSVIYMLSNDGQFLSLDPNSGVSEIGVPIGDKLSAFNPATAFVAVHNGGSKDKAVYVADGSTGWYRLNPTPAPESGFTWSPSATITGGCKAVQSIEVSPGVKRLLIGPTGAGHIYQRDLSVFQDNGASYSAFATIGSLVLAQPGGLALLDFITTDSLAIGSHPAVSVLIDEISGSFTSLPNRVADPTQLVASTTIFGDRFYFAQTGSPAACRHMQVKFSWPSENAANELLSFTLYGTHYNEKG